MMVFKSVLVWLSNSGIIFFTLALGYYHPLTSPLPLLAPSRDLQLLDERTAKKCERVEAEVKEEEVRYWHNIAQLLDNNRVRWEERKINHYCLSICLCKYSRGYISHLAEFFPIVILYNGEKVWRNHLALLPMLPSYENLINLQIVNELFPICQTDYCCLYNFPSLLVLQLTMPSLLAFFSQEAFQSFQELDSHINSVATKVVHLGDQLESVNTPR